MSDDLEQAYAALANGRVPASWSSVSFASLKALGPWIAELGDRVAFVRRWLRRGPPSCFNLAGFFFPQGFLTGALQRHARKYRLAINDLELECQVMHGASALPSVADGVLVDGLHLEGGRWDARRALMTDPGPRDRVQRMPPLALVPRLQQQQECDSTSYTCPVYKTQARAGALSTTGISTNFVVAVALPTDREAQHWVMSGTALVCSLSE